MKTPGTKQQKKPKKTKHTPSWDLVIKDMKARDKLGRKKYGVPLTPFNGRDSLEDAYQEVLDLAVYLRTLIEEDKHLSNLDNYGKYER